MAQNKEGKIQGDIVNALRYHPKVAWCSVVSSGTHRMKWGALKVGYYNTATEKQVPGMSDIIGQLTDGRFFSIEVKEPGSKPTKEQEKYIHLVNRFGGVSGWADNTAAAVDIIDNAFKG